MIQDLDIEHGRERLTACEKCNEEHKPLFEFCDTCGCMMVGGGGYKLVTCTPCLQKRDRKHAGFHLRYSMSSEQMQKAFREFDWEASGALLDHVLEGVDIHLCVHGIARASVCIACEVAEPKHVEEQIERFNPDGEVDVTVIDYPATPGAKPSDAEPPLWGPGFHSETGL